MPLYIHLENIIGIVYGHIMKSLEYLTNARAGGLAVDQLVLHHYAHGWITRLMGLYVPGMKALTDFRPSQPDFYLYKSIDK